jgi:hypothetical protein
MPKKYTSENPRFVWCIGAFAEAYPDIPYHVGNTPGCHLYDRQEKRIVATIAPEYQNSLCLETNTSTFMQPFTTLEAWFNNASNKALESEGIPGTK